MTVQPLPSGFSADPAVDRAEGCACGGAADVGAERVARGMAILRELAEIGLALARAVAAPVVAAAAEADKVERPAAPGGGDPSLAFSRIARAVRLTLALEGRLDQEWQGLVAEQAARWAAADQERRIRRGRGVVHKYTVQHIVGQIIEVEATERGGEAEGERLLADLYERLDDGDDLELFADRSVVVSVACICRDLGIAFSPADWVGEEWADEDWEVWDGDDAAALRAAPPWVRGGVRPDVSEVRPP